MNSNLHRCVMIEFARAALMWFLCYLILPASVCVTALCAVRSLARAKVRGAQSYHHRYQIVQSKRPTDSSGLQWEGRRKVAHKVWLTGHAASVRNHRTTIVFPMCMQFNSQAEASMQRLSKDAHAPHNVELCLKRGVVWWLEGEKYWRCREHGGRP